MRRGTAVVLGYTWPRFHPLSLYSLMVLFAEPARWSRLLIFHELKKKRRCWSQLTISLFSDAALCSHENQEGTGPNGSLSYLWRQTGPEV